MSQADATSMDSILRLPDVMRKTGLSESTIKRRMKDGNFPKSISLGIRAIGWSENAVNAWVLEHTTPQQPQKAA